ncbi:MAG: hypothetical protein PVSMB7_21310 [Chloroflexota bacterium]
MRNGADDAALARIDEKLGRLLRVLGRAEEGCVVLERAIEESRCAGDLEGLGRTMSQLAGILDQRDALERLKDTITEVEWGGPSPALSQLWGTSAMVHFGIGQYGESVSAAERATEIARAVGDNRAFVRSQVAWTTAVVQTGNIAEVLAAVSAAIPLAEETGETEALTFLLNGASYCSYLRGQMAESLEYAERMVELAHRIGLRLDNAFCEVSLAEPLIFLGHWARARECVQRAEEIYASTEPSAQVRWDAEYARVTRAWLALWSGRWDEAEGPLRRALASRQESGDLQGLEGTAWCLSELLVQTGRADEARKVLEPIAEQPGILALADAVTLAWVHLEAGKLDQAGATIESALERMRSREILLFQADGLRVQGMIAARCGRYEDAERSFAEAASMAHSMPFPYAEARALADWSLMSLSRGAADQGRRHLEEAHRIFQRLGAQKDVERTEQALARV